jgi:GTP-binding protein HflX
LPSGRDLLLTATVGFVRKLPHSLVEAFKSTLEEAVLADFIILVLDASNPYVDEHRATTERVLEELGAAERKTLTVLNKSDLVETGIPRACLQRRHSEALFLSTVTREGVEALLEKLERMCDGGVCELKLRVPPSRHDIIAMAHGVGDVVAMSYDPDGSANITLTAPNERKKQFEEFLAV